MKIVRKHSSKNRLFSNDHHHRICMVKSIGYPNYHIQFDNGREVIVDVEKLIEYKPEFFSPLKTVSGLFKNIN